MFGWVYLKYKSFWLNDVTTPNKNFNGSKTSRRSAKFFMTTFFLIRADCLEVDQLFMYVESILWNESMSMSFWTIINLYVLWWRNWPVIMPDNNHLKCWRWYGDQLQKIWRRPTSSSRVQTDSQIYVLISNKLLVKQRLKNTET